MSLLGILVVLMVLGFFAMCVIRMAPPYFEYLSVNDIVQRVAVEPETAGESIGSIRRKLENRFHTNQIYELDAKEVEIYRKNGETFIDANYEVRIPIIWRIDAVLKFDDLHYKVGSGEPMQQAAATAG